MTLNEYIKKLQELQQQGFGELPVKLADWNEGYADPSMNMAGKVRVVNRQEVFYKKYASVPSFVLVGKDTDYGFTKHPERLETLTEVRAKESAKRGQGPFFTAIGSMAAYRVKETENDFD